WGLDHGQREIPFRWKMVQGLGPVVALISILVSLFIFGFSRWLAARDRRQDAIPIAKSLLHSTKQLEQQITAAATDYNKVTTSRTPKDFTTNMLSLSAPDLQFSVPSGAENL